MNHNKSAGSVKQKCDPFTQILNAFLSLVGLDKIPCGAAVTWMLLKRYAYQRDTVIISHAKLAELRGISRRTAIRHVAELTDRGLISPEGRQGNRNQYRLLMPWAYIPMPHKIIWDGFLKLPNSMFEAVRRHEISDTDLLTWCVIRTLQRSGKPCSASYGYIAKTIGLSHRQVVQRRIDGLVSRGWINSETRHRKTCLLRAVVHRIKSGIETRQLSVVGGTQLVTPELHPTVTPQLHHLELPIQTSNENVFSEERPDAGRGTYPDRGTTAQPGSNPQKPTTFHEQNWSDPAYQLCHSEANSLDLDAFQNRYEDLNINVQHDAWRDYWLSYNRDGNPRWRDWPRGRAIEKFDGWCCNALRKQQAEEPEGICYDLPDI
jgi:DNA-binding Lrp family transcriptional regulator